MSTTTTTTPSGPIARTSPRGPLLTLVAALAALGALAAFSHGPDRSAPVADGRDALPVAAQARAGVVPVVTDGSVDRSRPSALEVLRHAHEEALEAPPTF